MGKYLKNKVLLLLCFLVSAIFFGLTKFSPSTYAQSLDDQIAQIQKQLSDLEKAIAPLQKESTGLVSKIKAAKSSITATETQITKLGNTLIDKQADLEVQEVLFGERVKRYYKNTKKYDPFFILVGSSDSQNILRQYTWYQTILNNDQGMIATYNQDIKSLNDAKSALEIEKKKLLTLKQSLESRFGYLSQELKKAEAYRSELSKKQKELVAQKEALFSTSVGDVSTSDDPASRADYNPGFSPAFAAFSFGAPHRKGMSQYGAYGRSKEGQNYETILKAYYGDIKIDKIDTSGSISVSGVGTIPFEDNYLVGIAEMPSSWGDKGGYEAQKAQAIAARTYALAYTNNRSGSICTTEACQVYSRSRYNDPGTWKRAVQDTRGMVIKSNKTGNIFSTMYASTSGGSTYSYTSLDHTTPMLWDTKCSGLGCWPNDSYEKISGSPWYYKGWYKTRNNVSCGRSHPWLHEDEFADIVNALLYYSRTKDASHLSQVKDACLGRDSNAWSEEELRNQVKDKNGPVAHINSVSVNYSTGGYTQEVNISTDRGSFSFSGDDFKQIFSIRAPGALHIKSSLFNIEKK